MKTRAMKRGTRGSGAASKNVGNPKTTVASTEKKTKNKDITDYTYYLGSARQASDYETTTNFVINHIKQTFDFGDDIAQQLKNLQEVETDGTPAAAKLLRKQYEMEFKMDYDGYWKRLLAYALNQSKVYALLWECCTPGMQGMLEGQKDFDDLENKPIKLLKAIREHALNYQENKYDMTVITDALFALLLTKQKEDEKLQDYTKRFRIAKEVFELHAGGPIVLTKIIEAMPEYVEGDKAKHKACLEESSERFYSYLYMINANKAKYGSLLKGLNTQHLLHTNQFPKTLTDAKSILNNHPHDNANKQKSKKDSKEKEKEKPSNDNKKNSEKEEQEVPLKFCTTWGQM